MGTSKINPTLRKILMPLAYALLSIALCISFGYCFKSFYFTSIYVDGNSMYPTLVGQRDNADYGVVEKHMVAKLNVKRYQIVTTTYPWESPDKVMIKRVLILPNETFRINADGEHSIELFDKQNNVWKKLPIPFERNLTSSNKTYPETTLGNDEYIVAGDNWSNSDDCLLHHRPITYSNIIGVVIKMEGRCTYDPDTHNITNKRPYATRYFFGVDY